MINAIPSKMVCFIHVYFCEAKESMQYRQRTHVRKLRTQPTAALFLKSLCQCMAGRIHLCTILQTVCSFSHSRHCATIQVKVLRMMFHLSYDTQESKFALIINIVCRIIIIMQYESIFILHNDLCLYTDLGNCYHR